METTILGLYRSYIRDILGFYGDYGKENGNYYSILGLYEDSGKENENYYNRLYRGIVYWILVNAMVKRAQMRKSSRHAIRNRVIAVWEQSVGRLLRDSDN